MFLIHAVTFLGQTVWLGLVQSFGFFWDSLFGLIFGFLVSAIVQVVLTPVTMERYLGGNLRGILSGTAFGIISSACSYGASAAARGFYRNGADIRAVFAFLISSTNMNLAIVILFWSLLGWRFAFAEFFGGIIIIAVVVTGLSIFCRSDWKIASSATIDGQPGQEDEEDHCCHSHETAASNIWQSIVKTALSDVRMLQNELLVGYLIAGFAAALIPSQWLSSALHYVGAVPFIGYVLLLLTGLLLAIVTFICSMGNVPIARFLAIAGIPLGANTTFIYGDLLVPPLIGIYRKSFPPKVVWSFLGFFTIGAMVAGALVDLVIGNGSHAPMLASMSAMSMNDRFTLLANIVAILAMLVVTVLGRLPPSHPQAKEPDTRPWNP